jgi:glycerol-3-phosphate dehydrogenase
LAGAYGSRWRQVWQYAEEHAQYAERIVEGLPYVAAEVAFAVDHELACTISDVFIRRTHIAFETRDHGVSASRRVASLMAPRLGWSEVEVAAQLAAYEQDVHRLFHIEML